MSRGPWSTWSRMEHRERRVEEIVAAALKDARECAKHPADFSIWRGSGMRPPCPFGDTFVATDVIVHEDHVRAGVRRACGIDPRTVSRWNAVLQEEGLAKRVHEGYVLLTLTKLWTVEELARDPWNGEAAARIRESMEAHRGRQVDREVQAMMAAKPVGSGSP